MVGAENQKQLHKMVHFLVSVQLLANSKNLFFSNKQAATFKAI